MATSYIPEGNLPKYGIGNSETNVISEIQTLLHARNAQMSQLGDALRISFVTNGQTGWNDTQYAGILIHIGSGRCWCLVGDGIGKFKFMQDNNGTWTVKDVTIA